jgi:NAD-dependent dihydropyrimidine dehydrogenase PreA subunit
MKRIVVAVFSGTGNARRAAGFLADELKESGRPVELVDLAKGVSIPQLASGDLLVLCTSILGFSVPSTVMQALKASPRSEGAAAAMLCVCGGVMHKGRISGGWSGAASMVALGVLRRKGYLPAASADVSYPENWTQMTEAAMGKDQKLILERGDGEAKAFGKSLKAGTRVFIKRNILTLTLVRFVGFVFRSFARRILAMMYIADDSCTSCGLCARTCPAKAIVMKDGRPYWTGRCAECNRCINLCPSSSIQTSTARLVLFAVLNIAVVFVASPLAKALLGALAPAWGGLSRSLSGFGLGLLIYIGLTTIQLGPVNTLIRSLERQPTLKHLFTTGFTRKYKRYMAPGFRPGEGQE